MKHKNKRIWTLALAMMFATSAIIVGLYFGVRDSAAGTLPLDGRSWQDAGHFDTRWFDDYTTTRGTESDPFLIGTAQEFAGLARIVNNGQNFAGLHIHLANDIDLTKDVNGQERIWVPIGNYRDLPFSGSFNGNFHTIIVPSVYEAWADSHPVWQHVRYAALFGTVSDSIFKNFATRGNVTTFVGGADGLEFDIAVIFVNASGTTIQNIINFANISLEFQTTGQTMVAGIAARTGINTSFLNVANYGNIYAKSAFGAAGIVVQASGTAIAPSRIANSYNVGSVTVHTLNPAGGAVASRRGAGGIFVSFANAAHPSGINNVFSVGTITAPVAYDIGNPVNNSPVPTSIQNAFYGLSIDGNLLGNLNTNADALRAEHPEIATWVMGDNDMPVHGFRYRFTDDDSSIGGGDPGEVPQFPSWFSENWPWLLTGGASIMVFMILALLAIELQRRDRVIQA